jgi:hypothetical protein
VSQSNLLEPSDDTIAALQNAVAKARRREIGRRRVQPETVRTFVADFDPWDAAERHLMTLAGGVGEQTPEDWLELASFALQAYEAAKAKEGG